MGVDFQHVGSMTQGRFEKELCAIAEIFGGRKTESLQKEKFTFPEGTNDVLVRWFNDIYELDFTKEETEIIWKYISEHPEIEEISNQIWNELKKLAYDKEEWYIY